MRDQCPQHRPPRCLIVNADDFGQTRGVNRGIVECHQRGIVTSTSLMVTGAAVDEAVELARANPRMSVGLHFDVWGEDEREFDTHDLPATRDELHRQLERFSIVMGRLPTHIDSHRHAHREEHLFEAFREWVSPLGLPLRGDGRVKFVGGFYGQWEWGVTEMKYIGVEFLQQMLHNEVSRDGVTEFSCHPGYVHGSEGEEYRGIYRAEREVEIATLTHPEIAQSIQREGIRLISYAELAELDRPEARAEESPAR